LKTEKKMNTAILKMYIKFQELASREEGQDLVEYALVVALIAFGATAGMKALAALASLWHNNASQRSPYYRSLLGRNDALPVGFASSPLPGDV
jgi:pilus assembly protein Flp/PilA